MAIGGWCRLCVLMFVVVLCESGSFARTLVPPGNVSGTWTAANSPYVIKTGNITVPNGSSLIIEPGVVVNFAGHHKFIINGHLRAIGTETDSIRFLSDGREGLVRGWKGLRLIGADSSIFDYCVIEDGNAILSNSSDSTGGAAFISGAGTLVVFRHTSFRNNFAGGNGGALFVSGGTSAHCFDCCFSDNYSAKDGGAAFINNSSGTRFERCRFDRNSSGKEAGAIHTRFGAPTYIDCEFSHNISFNSGGAVMASGQPSFRRCLFQRNVSESSQGGALYFYDSLTTATLDSCLILENRTLLRDGGGAYCWEASPRFTDCQFIGNVSADDGGGIHCYRLGANPIFTRCLFEGNSSADRGGGIKISRYSRATLTDCIIRNNRSNGTGGGGVFCRLQCEPVFTNCVIENNSSTGTGGGLCTIESNPRFYNCRFSSNVTDSSGGGIFATDADVDLTDCEVRGNYARMNGGGIYLTLSSPDIIRTRVSENHADSLGGGLFMNESVSRVVNGLICGNNSGRAGGGVWIGNSNPLYEHCTIADNVSTVGHAFFVNNTPGTLLNSIIANRVTETGNGATPGTGFAAGSVAWTIRNTLFHAVGNPQFGGSFPSGFGLITTENANGTQTDGFGNIFENPRFNEDSAEPYSLQTENPASPALNATNSGFAIDLSLSSRPSPALSLADLGCFEATQSEIGSGVWGVQTGELSGEYHRVFGDIIVPENQTWTIAAGTELEFMGPYAIIVYGTLTVDGTESEQVRFTADSISNLTLWRGIRFADAGSSNSEVSHAIIERAQSWPIDSAGGAVSFFHGSSPRLQSCQIRESNATTAGGGILVVSGNPELLNCVIENCSSPSGGAVRLQAGQSISIQNSILRNCSSEIGGAISGEGSTIDISGSILEDNVAEDGGAIHLRNSSLNLQSCRMEDNQASRFGGAVYSSNSEFNCDSMVIVRSTAAQGGASYLSASSGQINRFECRGNSALESGGAYLIQGSNVNLSRGLILDNYSVLSGGGLSLLNDSSHVTRCTIVSNSSQLGSAAYVENSTSLISSCMIAENGSAIHFRNGAASRVEYSNFDRNAEANFTFHQNSNGHGPSQIGLLIAGNHLDHGSDIYSNIFAVAGFVNSGAGDFRVMENSDCMDAGDPLLDCDDDLTFIEIGAYHTPHTENPWPPDELSVEVLAGDSLNLNWRSAKPFRMCNPDGLFYVVEQEDSAGVWQTTTVTPDTSCTIPAQALIGRVTSVRVRSQVGP